MDEKNPVDVAFFEQMTPVVESVSRLLQKACVPCLNGDLARAIEGVGRAAHVIATAQLLDPEDLELWHGFARHLIHMWVLPTHWEALVRLLRIYPWDAQTHSHLLHGLHFLPETPATSLARQHRRWAQRHGRIEPWPQQGLLDDRPDRRLRVGYLSPDFRCHCVAQFMMPVLAAHDRSQFVLVGYSDVPPNRRDAITDEIMGQFDVAHDICEQSNDDVAQRIRNDRIDILVDLAGHTHPQRLPLFAGRVAPVQVTYLGYPNTTGLTQIDYRLTDHILDEPGADDNYSETLWRLERCFACYRVPSEAPEVCEPPVLQGNGITFGAFVGSEKHNPQVVSLWAQILQRNPGSRLLLRFKDAEQGVIQQQCREAFTRCGIARDRILFDGFRPYVDHLAQYGQIDIALDTFPWSSHTSLCEVLWMGVPVVTWCGDMAVSRMGASVLHHLGQDAWVAHNAQQYVEIATQLVQDVPGLVETRRTLRQRMQTSAVCDGPGQARALEAAYRQMWQLHVKGVSLHA